MKKTELQKLLRAYERSINKTAAGLYILMLSPAVLTALSAYRIYSMPRINALGILWIALCVLLSLPLLIRGIAGMRQSARATAGCLTLSCAACDYYAAWHEQGRRRRLSALIIALCVCLLGVVPLVALYALRLGNSVYLLYAYAAAFCGAGGLAILLGAAAKLVLFRRISVVCDPEIEDAPPEGARSGTKGRARLACALLLAGALAFLLCKGNWYIQPYIATIPSVQHRELPIRRDAESGDYILRNDDGGAVRILQLTDIHLGGSLFSYAKDMRALETVYRLIEHTHPDLIIVTGDFVFPLGFASYSFNNYTPLLQFASFLRNIGVPWALTYGNHDTEFLATHTEAEIDALFTAFAYETTGTLLYPSVQPPVTGRSNQRILIENSDGSINQALYLLDSNAYTGEGVNAYDCIHDDQVQWYVDSLVALAEDRGALPSSLIFTHIPLQEYRTAYELHKRGSPEVTYFYGGIGEKDEAICCSKEPSRLFDDAVALGSLRGVFVGHDHYNNLSVAYKNVRLTYGMSIDYLAMPGIAEKTAQRGGTLITLHADSTFDCAPVPYAQLPATVQ